MHLKKDIDPASFLQAVGRCKGEVILRTSDGDVLNLKSKLSQFVFAALLQKTDLIRSAQIEEMSGEDREMLRGFLTA